MIVRSMCLHINLISIKILRVGNAALINVVVVRERFKDTSTPIKKTELGGCIQIGLGSVKGKGQVYGRVCAR